MKASQKRALRKGITAANARMLVIEHLGVRAAAELTDAQCARVRERMEARLRELMQPKTEVRSKDVSSEGSTCDE